MNLSKIDKQLRCLRGVGKGCDYNIGNKYQIINIYNFIIHNCYEPLQLHFELEYIAL